MRIDEMPAGREMDKAIGQHIFKYWVDHYDKDYAENCYYCLMDGSGDAVIPGLHEGERRTEEEAWADCPEFSTDIAAAWEVLNKFTHKEPCINYLNDLWNPVGWHCHIDGHHTEGCDTAQLVICRCALKVAGVTEI